MRSLPSFGWLHSLSRAHSTKNGSTKHRITRVPHLVLMRSLPSFWNFSRAHCTTGQQESHNSSSKQNFAILQRQSGKQGESMTFQGQKRSFSDCKLPALMRKIKRSLQHTRNTRKRFWRTKTNEKSESQTHYGAKTLLVLKSNAFSAGTITQKAKATF